ncbi:MAG TPA: VWA domain-containing protein [Terriglobia bacterium]|nr:VWA domain-containing protein [Terriglobia bacterium]
MLAAAAILLALLPVSTFAQAPVANAPASSRTDHFKISVNVGLVVLPVTVTNRRGDFVSGLRAQNFQVYEAGRPQPITLFEPEDVPVTVGLVVDNSGSMGPKRPGVVAASLAFVASSNPGDQMFVVNFNQRVLLGLPSSMPFTSDAGLLRGALAKNPPSGNTALYDGIAAGLEHLKAGTGERRALIVVSDGGDNASHLRLQNLLKTAESSNAIIYTIGILDQTYSDENPGVLKQLAKATGGQAYFPQSASEVSNVAEQIAREIRRQYTIGYVPSSLSSSGNYRAIRVKVSAAGDGKLYVRTRAGYLISPEAPSAAGPAR